MKFASIFAIVLCATISARADSTVVVTPSNMHGWSFGSFDNNFNPVTSGDFFGTSEMVTGPAGQPLGTGSAHLATNSGHGDGAEIIATNNFEGTAISSLTSMGYWSFMASNGPTNNQQFPYMLLAISTDGKALAGDGSNLDFVEFEPPYQTHATGNSSLPDQGATALGQWQSWNALEGGWYDGTIGGSGGTNVAPFSAFLSAFPDATIADPSSVFPGFAGINLQVGFADADSLFDGNVDAFNVGVAGNTTTYDFEPGVSTSTPLPASLAGGIVLFLVVGAISLAKRRGTVYETLN